MGSGCNTLAVTRWQGVWRWLALAPFVVLGGDVLLIAVSLALDPTSHNLWPLELLFVDLACLPFLGLVWQARIVMKAA